MALFPNSVVTPKEAYSPDRWRKRSEMTRDRAACVANPIERSRLLKIATEYERLASYAEEVRAGTSDTDTNLGCRASLPMQGSVDFGPEIRHRGNVGMSTKGQ